MQKYENLVIFNASLSDEEKAKIVDKYTAVIEKLKGSVTGVNVWGVKKLAYPINYKSEGHYVLFEFEGEPNVPNEINALMRIDENVMRNLCLKKN